MVTLLYTLLGFIHMIHVRVDSSHPSVDVYVNVSTTPNSLSSQNFFTSTPMYENSFLIPSPIASSGYQTQTSSSNQSLNCAFIEENVQLNKIISNKNTEHLYDRLFNDQRLTCNVTKSNNKDKSLNNSRISKIVPSIVKPTNTAWSNIDHQLTPLSYSKNYTLKQILDNVENIQSYSTNSDYGSIYEEIVPSSSINNCFKWKTLCKTLKDKGNKKKERKVNESSSNQKYNHLSTTEKSFFTFGGETLGLIALPNTNYDHHTYENEIIRKENFANF
ncbi:unnamed protein product [Didymodactylos carnosus]|uniref:Uncharacterized protein n=1 Tax=Didymodactylos carnosus TaxID=1234261 RepID=A0A813T4C4_9BILA|nr:unnamed protein product [Didymodactylos carnosus]CAF3588439.1 unnamed protein product [Didymodactylos carnosus]